MMKDFLFLSVILFSLISCKNVELQKVSSPDGETEITFQLKKGMLFYSLKRSGEVILNPSRLGFKLANNDSLYANFEIIGIKIDKHDETWQQPWGEEVSVRNHYNELSVNLKEMKGKLRLLNVIFRVFNDGVGFRYGFPEQKNLKNFEIIEELTEFALSKNDSVWSIPAYKGLYYEMLWKKMPASQLDTVTTPITIETAEGKYILLHEANLTDYAKMNLYPVSGATLKADLTPWSTGVKVYAKTPFVTPWRTIALSDDLNQLVNNRIMLNLNEPCKIENTSWLKPARYMGIWWGMHMEKYSWAQGPKHGATTENTKKYIDFAAVHNMNGVLVEGWNFGWDGDWVANGDKFNFTKAYPDYDINDIVNYAKSKGVEMIGHNETGGSTINYENQLDSAFGLYHQLGINYVKTGYVNPLLDKKERHDSQYGVRHYRKVIETAAKYGIIINNHEPVMPTGLQRTYPNLMSQEGERGQEYDAWSNDGGNPPEHTCIVPFTRGLAGPMDFTFGTFNFKNSVFPNTRVQTTIAKQLALYVIIYSPLQMASDLLENYSENPAFEFIEEVPVDWAKTIILDGEIGKYVITARKDRNSSNWYVGAITNGSARQLSLNLSFLEKDNKYKMKLFMDAPDANWKTNPYSIVIDEKKEVNRDSIINLNLAPGGGTAISFQKL